MNLRSKARRLRSGRRYPLLELPRLPPKKKVGKGKGGVGRVKISPTTHGTVSFAPLVVASSVQGRDSKEDDAGGRDSPVYVGFPILDASQVKQEDGVDEEVTCLYTSAETPQSRVQTQYDFSTFAPLSTKWLGRKRCQPDVVSSCHLYQTKADHCLCPIGAAMLIYEQFVESL